MRRLNITPEIRAKMKDRFKQVLQQKNPALWEKIQSRIAAKKGSK